MCVSSIAAACLKSSPVRWIRPPVPEEAKVSLPGLAFAAATKSRTERAGDDVDATARRERHDEADRARGIGLCGRRERGSERHHQKSKPPHQQGAGGASASLASIARRPFGQVSLLKSTGCVVKPAPCAHLERLQKSW